MNTRRSKRRRKSGQKGFKTKTKDGEAEVFVLPPDLLKKLGINLGSVQCYQGCPTELTNYTGDLDLSTALVEKPHNTEVPQLASEQSHNNVSQRHSTILETADLMKKSVFLSPTFVNSSNNIDTGELEISNGIEPENINENTLRNSIDIDDSNSISKQIAYAYPDSEKDILPSQINSTEINDIKNNCDHKNEIERSITLDSKYISKVIPHENNQISLCNNVVTDIFKKSSISGSTDDHSDEAYLSDCSNSNLGPSDTDYISEKKDLELEVPKEFEHKIKILSEEIISSSKLKDLQMMLSPKTSNFIPVSMNCLLKSKSLSENSEYNTPYNNNICMPEGEEHSIVVLYDEVGKLISNVSKSNMALTTSPHKISNQIEAYSTMTKFESRTPENSFGDIDLAVIDMEIEENEDILEKFVNEITSNDDNKILEKIEQSEKDSPSKSNDLEILQVNTKGETKNTYFKINNDELSKDEAVENKCNDRYIKLIVFDSNQTERDSNFCNQLEENTEFSQISHMVKSNKNIGTVLETIQPNISKITNLIDTMQKKDKIVNNENNTENNCLPTDLNSMEKNAIESLPESETKSNVSTEIFPPVEINKIPIETKEVQQNTPSNMTIGHKIASIDFDLINMKNEATECLSKLRVISETKDEIVQLLKIEDRKINADPKEMHDDGINVATDTTTNDVITKEEISLPTPRNDTYSSVQQAYDDKIKEIAMYLSQFAKNKSSSVKLKRKSDKKLNISSKRSESSPLTSKLRIQGVEKPGGSEKSDKNNTKNKVLKTYTKSKKIDNQSFSVSEVVAPPMTTKLPELSYSVDEQERYCDIVEKGARKPEYCLCSDFGRLAYYDTNYPYEHIHFWEHKIDCCDRDTVFSIYNSDNNINSDIKELSDIPEENGQKSDKCVYSICWHSFKKEPVGNQNNEILKIVTQESLPHMNEGEALSNINKSNKEICILQSKHVNNTPLDTNSELNHGGLDTKVVETASKNLPSSSHSKDLTFTCDLQTGEENVLREDNQEDIKSSVNQNQSSPNSIETNLIPLSEQSEVETDKNKKSKSEDINMSDLDDHIMIANSERESDHQIMAEKCSTADSTQEANAPQHVDDSKSDTKDKSAAVKDNTTEVIDVPDSSTSSRKRKHEENDEKEPKAKKSVKCDVCKNTVSKSEWDSHVSTEHCFIAWKCGSTFDFEKPRLLKKLQEKVKTSSILKCTFCNAELIRPKKFLTHVQRCFAKLEASFESSTNETTADDTADDVTQPEENVLQQAVVDTTNVNESITSDDNVSKCGVCKEIITSSEWIKHITDKHDYLAWKDGDTPLNLDDDDDVRQHLINVVREIGQLTCSKCGLSRKYPKSYMQHFQHCTGSQELQKTQEDIDVKLLKTEELKPSDVVKCAVCSKSMPESEWMQHIKEDHEYLAWREREQPLNTDDEESVRNHLYDISKQNDGLECVKCGCVRKYVKSYLVHIKSCQENTVSEKLIAAIDSTPKTDETDIRTQNTRVKCGVCGKEVWSEKWIHHISKAHNYMAWKEGESLDLNNSEEVYNHLYNIVKKTGYLACSKCGHIRKYVKPFLQHVSICDAVPPQGDHDDSSDTQENSKQLVCALCSEEVFPQKWKNHKMEKHYNVAWTVGSIPVDYKNANVIDILIKEYMAKYKKMVCKVCHASRVSRVGFYAHVIACGKTEEEIEEHKTLCDICNKKYLCVYHNQHMAWHTQQEIAKVKKLKAQEEEEQSAMATPKQEVVKEEEVVVTGQRRAAQKARNMIENFSNEESAYRCPDCKFGSDTKKGLAKHVCGRKDEYFSDSGESMKLEIDSGEESDDTIEVDSDASDEEEEEQAEAPKKKKKSTTYYSVPRFPHVTQKLTTFLTKIGAEFHLKHLTKEILYSDLRVFNCEPIPVDQLGAYLPPLEVSCQVRFCENSWKTYKRFETERKKCMHAKSISVVPCHSMFTGGCIQCISWAPPGPEEEQAGGSLLAVACHRGSDIPRMVIDDIAPHPGLIQFWDFDDFSQAPVFAFGLAHDYGTAWAMDWCPAGARDAWPDDGPGDGHVLRLGLLAVAFSTGCVAIFSVPHPSTLVNREQLIQKLKPVVELRMTINPERKVYQATSVSWSMQKPYECILVGYGDGTTAYFDLNTESPLLKTVQDNLVILYPYHDERVHSTCITGVGLYPSVGETCPAAVSSSRTGAALVSRAGVRPARQHAALAAGHAHFQPLWPAAALTGDEANIGTSVNEVEWFGGGRRLGGGNTGAGCRHCGRYALAAAPLIRVRFPHPADNVSRREILGVLQMAPLGKDRKKLANDELQTIVEPTTYDDAVRKYGVELRIDKESIEKAASRPRDAVPERRPERFPLGDVTALAFCPAAAHHRKLAAGTHCGMLFLIQT